MNCSKISKSQTFRKDLRGNRPQHVPFVRQRIGLKMSGRSSALSERWPWPDALGVPPWTAGNAWFLDRCWRGPCRWSSCGWHHYVDAGMLPGLWWGWFPTRCGLAYPIISHYHYLPLLFPYSLNWIWSILWFHVCSSTTAKPTAKPFLIPGFEHQPEKKKQVLLDS